MTKAWAGTGLLLAAVLAGTGLLFAAILALTGCQKSTHTSSLAAPPTTHAEHVDVQKGEALVARCIPNGHTVVTTVLAGTASGLTYYQLLKFIVKDHGISRVWTCLATRPGPVPAPQLKAALEKCGAQKVTPILEGDHHWARDRRILAPQILNAAAVCAGTYA